MASTVIDMLPLDTFVQLGDFWESIARDHIVVVLVLHCLFCASLAPELKHSYMVHYLVRRWSECSRTRARHSCRRAPHWQPSPCRQQSTTPGQPPTPPCNVHTHSHLLRPLRFRPAPLARRS